MADAMRGEIEISMKVKIDNEFILSHENQILKIFVDQIENTETIVKHLDMYNQAEGDCLKWFIDKPEEWLVEDDKNSDYSMIDDHYKELYEMKKFIEKKINMMDEILDMKELKDRIETMEVSDEQR